MNKLTSQIESMVATIQDELVEKAIEVLGITHKEVDERLSIIHMKDPIDIGYRFIVVDKKTLEVLASKHINYDHYIFGGGREKYTF